MTFKRALGPFDATMVVIGGIIGSGIFINPYVVAQTVETPFLIFAVWGAGGLIALAGAFIFAELSTVMPRVGGQYAFFREAFHPLIAFLHGWSLLFADRHPGAGGPAHYAAYLEDAQGFEVELVASDGGTPPTP